MADGRELRIAAVGDLHYGHAGRGTLADVFAGVDRAADVLALCGDLTAAGRPEQMNGFVDELATLEIPIVAVLGNHDHEADAAEELTAILEDRGVRVLQGESVVIEGVGFAGVKGFAGGFDGGALAPFGEKLIKDFVQHAVDDALALENALRKLETEHKVVMLHYSPVVDTIAGELESIYPFLGSSRLLAPIETLGASVVLHGHAHRGRPEGVTPGGIPVYNVARPLLRREAKRDFRVWPVALPERRRG